MFRRGNPEDGYADAHLPFRKGDALSDRILNLTRKVINSSPNLKTITLEIRGSKNMTPADFAHLMIQQVSILRPETNSTELEKKRIL